MPPPTRRPSDRRGGSAERPYQLPLGNLVPFGRSQTSAPSAKPTSHPYQPTHWTPKPATDLPGRDFYNTPYSRPVALHEASQRADVRNHTAATWYVHRARQGDEGPLWDPALEEVPIRASPRISEIQQEHRTMTPDINWNSQLSRESHHPTAPFRSQQTSREGAVLTHSYTFHSDEAHDNFELRDEVLAEHCERMEEEGKSLDVHRAKKGGRRRPGANGCLRFRVCCAYSRFASPNSFNTPSPYQAYSPAANRRKIQQHVPHFAGPMDAPRRRSWPATPAHPRRP